MAEIIRTEGEVRRGMVMARDLGVAPSEESPTIAVASGDMVHWGSVWGGFFVTLASGLILMALPIAFGARPASTVSAWGLILAMIGALIATYVGSLLTGYLCGAWNRTLAGLNGLILGCVIVASTVLASIGGAAAGRVMGLFPLSAFITPNTVTPEAIGAGWGFIISAILLVAVGFAGGVQGENLHEEQIAKSRGRT
ncbi:MAG: hypothetical protein HY692_07270 [Cyanobacteria bacterium NC_groundwater_1444_Ag_S-0.65um_54_12]|nr:hypothetical protein [Cyanobacteria bacterium NC_groundwater_1444_Ag_S-0.65um_54_12]